MDKSDIVFVINALRRATTTWPGRNDCINRGRRQRLIGKLKNGKPKFLWENDCEICKKYFDLKDDKFEVDHIVEINSFKGDWNDFIPRMFCPQSNLQRLCIPCHLVKTSRWNSTRLYTRKEIPNPTENKVDESWREL